MKTTVIHAKGAIVGVGDEKIEGVTVVVHDGVITAVGPTGAVAVPAGDDVLEHRYDDGWLLPGLIDTHVHLTLPGDGRGQEFVEERTDLQLLLVAVQNAQAALRAGVTTLRDVGSRGQTVMALRDAINAGDMMGPRLLVSGAPVTITGGHCHYFGGEADGVDGVRRRARALVKSGADLIKVIGSGGGTRNVNHGKPSYTPAEVRAAVEEAERFSRRMTIHAVCTEAVAAAVEAGAHMIEHSAFWSQGPDGSKHSFRADLTEAMVEKGIYVCPTLQASYGEIQRLRSLQEQGRLSPGLREELDSRLRLFEATMETAGRMYEMGVRQVAGTDCGYDRNPFGEGYVTGLELAVEAGMPHWAAIEHATSLAAAAVGIGDVTGALRKGLQADIVVVPGDPSQNVSVLRRPSAVYRVGHRVFDRDKEETS